MGGTDTKLKIVIDAQNNTQGVFNTLKSDLDGIAKQHEGLTTAMKAVGTAGTVAFGGLALITKGAVEAGANFEQTQISFETMLGSASKAQKLLNDLAQFAERTPFELPQVEAASKQLLAYGVAAEDLLPTLKMLGDISSGVGMDKLPNLILALGQVKAATHLTGMELRQFTEAGVPLLDALSQTMHKSVAEIQDMVSAGEVGFPDVQAALASLTGEGGRFQDLMQKQSASLAGLWSNFHDQISLTARAIGDQLLPYLKPLVEELIALATQVGQFVKDHPKLSAAILIVSLAFTGLLAVLLPIAFALPGLILMFTGLAAAFTFLASGPGIVVVATLVGIGVAIYSVIGIVSDLTTHWNETWLGIKLIAADVANAVIGFMESMVNAIIDGVNLAIKAVNKVIAAIQKVPGIGKKFGTIGLLDDASFGRIDTDTIASSAVNRQAASNTPAQVTITGNTFLSKDVAEQIGDMILGKLKLSNAL